MDRVHLGNVWAAFLLCFVRFCLPLEWCLLAPFGPAWTQPKTGRILGSMGRIALLGALFLGPTPQKGPDTPCAIVTLPQGGSPGY